MNKIECKTCSKIIEYSPDDIIRAFCTDGYQGLIKCEDCGEFLITDVNEEQVEEKKVCGDCSIL